MSDSPVFRSPVLTSYTAASTDAPLTLSDETPTSRTLLRASPGGPTADHLGVAYGASRVDGDVLVAGSRVDEWLLIGPAQAVADRVAELPTEEHVSVIDWTHGRAMFRLTGEPATGALEKVCGLDWSDDMTPDGAVVSGSVAKVSCDIIRSDRGDAPSYLILCDRSFGQYLFDTLIDAADEFGVDVNVNVKA